WLASAGIVGLALSFAAKDTLANLFAGMAILVDAPYKLGDFIILETGERGEVTNIGMRSTRILTRDDVEITIPNGLMGNSKIVNQSGGPHTNYRIRIKISCAYGSDIDHVRQLLMNAAEEEPGVCESPEPRVRFRSFGDSGLAFELLCWVRLPVMRGQIEDKLNCDIYKRFAKEGIEIPYPKQDVYVRHLPSSTQAQG
ncbi:MAG: mechanosensitive ion channel family protein, partial [Gammaproteobacteria bacterium]